jgi:hypothetical protein
MYCFGNQLSCSTYFPGAAVEAEEALNSILVSVFLIASIDPYEALDLDLRFRKSGDGRMLR